MTAVMPRFLTAFVVLMIGLSPEIQAGAPLTFAVIPLRPAMVPGLDLPFGPDTLPLQYERPVIHLVFYPPEIQIPSTRQEP